MITAPGGAESGKAAFAEALSGLLANAANRQGIAAPGRGTPGAGFITDLKKPSAPGPLNSDLEHPGIGDDEILKHATPGAPQNVPLLALLFSPFGVGPSPLHETGIPVGEAGSSATSSAPGEASRAMGQWHAMTKGSPSWNSGLEAAASVAPDESGAKTPMSLAPQIGIDAAMAPSTPGTSRAFLHPVTGLHENGATNAWTQTPGPTEHGSPRSLTTDLMAVPETGPAVAPTTVILTPEAGASMSELTAATAGRDGTIGLMAEAVDAPIHQAFLSAARATALSGERVPEERRSSAESDSKTFASDEAPPAVEAARSAPALRQDTVVDPPLADRRDSPPSLPRHDHAITPAVVAASADVDGQAIAERMAETMGQHMLAAINRGNWRIEVGLHPAHLGRIDVRMQFRSGGRIDAEFDSANDQARGLLTAGLPKLREVLEVGGLSVGQMEVRDESRRQGDRRQSPSPKTDSPFPPEQTVHQMRPAPERSADVLDGDHLDVTV